MLRNFVYLIKLKKLIPYNTSLAYKIETHPLEFFHKKPGYWGHQFLKYIQKDIVK